MSVPFRARGETGPQNWGLSRILRTVLIATTVIFTNLLALNPARADATLRQSDTQSTAENQAESDLRRAKLLTFSGVAITAVGTLTFVSGLGIGAAALYHLGDQDTSAVFGFVSLATMGVALPFLAVGLPMLAIGRKRWKQIEQATAWLPTPFFAKESFEQPVSIYGLRWQCRF